MFCYNCGVEIKREHKFCFSCGIRLEFDNPGRNGWERMTPKMLADKRAVFTYLSTFSTKFMTPSR
jgi:hypothetical protein